MFVSENIDDELARIVERIGTLSLADVKFHNICILFPQLKTANPLKERFKKESINYVVINDFRFDSIINEYSEMIDQIEKYIKMRCKRGLVSAVIEHIIGEHYSSRDKEDLVLETIKNFSKNFDSGEYSSIELWVRLQEFYNHLQMDIEWSKLARRSIKNRVFLSTIHGAKGLEFDYVLLFGIVDFRMPYHTLCYQCKNYGSEIDSSTDESEDLFYVGVSRAMKDVFFFFSRQDEQKPSQKNRKISCVFDNLLDNLKFINSQEREFSRKDAEIVKLICIKPKKL